MSVFYNLTRFNPALGVFALVLVTAVTGAYIGAFCAKLVYRLPGSRFKGVSALTPSFCPMCGRELRWGDKQPIIGYLRVRGRCRRCGQPIPKRYLVFELTGMLLPFVVLWFEDYMATALFDYGALMILMTAGVISADTHTLPWVLSCALIAVGALALLVRPQPADQIYTGAGVGVCAALVYAGAFKAKQVAGHVLYAGALGFYLGFKRALLAAALFVVVSLGARAYAALEKKPLIASTARLSAAGGAAMLFAPHLFAFLTRLWQFMTVGWLNII